MRRSCWILTALLLLAVGARDARAYTIVLDMDATTAGIQASVAVTAGSTITVTGILTSVTGFAIFDHVGVDLSWSKPGETASLTSVSTLAGGLAGVGPGPVLDFFTSGVLAPGTPLSTAGFGAVGTNAFNLGGFAYWDSSLTSFGFFGAPFGPPGTAIDLFSVDFVVTGAVGSSVTVDPSGLWVPGFTTPPPTPVAGGDALYDSVVTLFTTAGSYTGGLVSVVPEPGRGLLCLGALGAFALRRRLSA